MKTLRRALPLCLLLAAGCARPASNTQSAPLPPKPWKAAAIAHVGAGSPPGLADGCRKAVDAALAVLDAGGEPVDAAVAGVVVLEDDPRFNAGTGSRVRLDGKTVQMDASVMTSDGRFAAVAAIEDVKNPVRVARAVLDTPHVLLAGDGATRFARTLGMPPYDPATPEMLAKTRALQDQLRENSPSLPAEWRTFDWRAHWNFPTPISDTPLAGPPAGAPSPDAGAPASDAGAPVSDAGAHDTVGVAVRASDGRFAAALSTGGTAITLSGRVGDVPVYGAGLFAGPRGASAATGTGERIIESALSRRVNEWLEAGKTPEEAALLAVEEVKKRGGDIGVIVIGPQSMSAAADRQMAWAGRESGSTTWYGPAPSAAPPH